MNKINLIEFNIFDLEDKYYLAHCISADFALGAGIAKEFDIRYDLRTKLFNRYPGYVLGKRIMSNPEQADCILIDKVFNLVTKSRYWQKPTYDSLSVSLNKMKNICIQNNITKVAMPTIGCGLDKLDFDKVYNRIEEVFKDINIEILICVKPSGIIH